MLDRMLEYGHISEKEHDRAVASKLDREPRQGPVPERQRVLPQRRPKGDSRGVRRRDGLRGRAQDPHHPGPGSPGDGERCGRLHRQPGGRRSFGLPGLHRTRNRRCKGHGRRLGLRPGEVQPRDPGAPAGGKLVQALRLRGGRTRGYLTRDHVRLQAPHHRHGQERQALRGGQLRLHPPRPDHAGEGARRLGQHGLRPVGPGSRPPEGGGDGQRAGHRQRGRRLPFDRDRGPQGRGYAAGDGLGLLDLRQLGYAHGTLPGREAHEGRQREGHAPGGTPPLRRGGPEQGRGGRRHGGAARRDGDAERPATTTISKPRSAAPPRARRAPRTSSSTPGLSASYRNSPRASG